MPLLALVFALAAAVIHAFWNLLLARAPDTESTTAVAFVAAVVVFAPVTALIWRVDSRVWPFIAVTSVLQLVYFALLATAYRRSELSVSAGLASFGAYALVLAALERVSAASVAAVRETSIVIATALAAPLLKERVGPTRFAGAVAFAVGVALLAG